jgi:hypothetical protein
MCNGVEGRTRVRHAAHQSKTAGRRSCGSRGYRLLLLESRLAQVTVKIDERRGQHESVAIDVHAVVGNRTGTLRDRAIEEDDISHAIPTGQRVDDSRVMKDEIQRCACGHVHTTPGRNPAASASAADANRSRFSGRIVAAHLLRAG